MNQKRIKKNTQFNPIGNRNNNNSQSNEETEKIESDFFLQDFSTISLLDKVNSSNKQQREIVINFLNTSISENQEEIVPAFIKKDIIKKLMPNLLDASIDIRMSATSLLINILGLENNEITQRAIQLNIISPIISALRSGLSEIPQFEQEDYQEIKNIYIEQLITLIWMLVEVSEKVLLRINNSNIIELIFECLNPRVFPENVNIAAGKCINILLGDNFELEQKILKIPQIGNLLKKLLEKQENQQEKTPRRSSRYMKALVSGIILILSPQEGLEIVLPDLLEIILFNSMEILKLLFQENLDQNKMEEIQKDELDNQLKKWDFAIQAQKFAFEILTNRFSFENNENEQIDNTGINQIVEETNISTIMIQKSLLLIQQIRELNNITNMEANIINQFISNLNTTLLRCYSLIGNLILFVQDSKISLFVNSCYSIMDLFLIDDHVSFAIENAEILTQILCLILKNIQMRIQQNHVNSNENEYNYLLPKTENDSNQNFMITTLYNFIDFLTQFSKENPEQKNRANSITILSLFLQIQINIFNDNFIQNYNNFLLDKLSDKSVLVIVEVLNSFFEVFAEDEFDKFLESTKSIEKLQQFVPIFEELSQKEFSPNFDFDFDSEYLKERIEEAQINLNGFIQHKLNNLKK
ncbi:hypothetical protein M0811_02612 [Anaeramoeba ignava]|uniref:Armadillo-type fold n=1 Tax=Anaeramoeba ignava TaxID=1746090 RepID=A0A9Q0R7F0_ANAIG|nr:hypothetical protein M0811_02612 [Anaeramoeba ignava]